MSYVRLLLLSALATGACGGEGSAVPDASPVDASVPPDAPSADAGPPGPCPTASDFVGNPAWTSQLQVTDSAHYCAYSSGATVVEDLRNKVELTIAVGTYPWPAAPGTEPVTLPLCLTDASGAHSMLTGPGSVVTEPNVLDGRRHTVTQPLRLGGVDLGFRMGADTYPGPAMVAPVLVLDEALDHYDAGETHVMIEVCSATSCSDGVRRLLPCQPDDVGREEGILFDRGELTVRHVNVTGFEPVGEGALTRAHGSLDGTAFDVTGYYRLAHLPDHHNSGGAFLVLFDEPISGACALEAEIPSADGSFRTDVPVAWLLDCDLTRVEELTGVERDPAAGG